MYTGGRIMREIKYRAWDKIDDEFLFSEKLGLSEFFLIIERRNEVQKSCILEQFTGLRDKNGKEIYEGDILKLTEDCRNYHYYNGRIFQCKYVIAFGTTPGLFFVSHGELIDINTARKPEKYEIIGNIHENPELIEQVAEY